MSILINILLVLQILVSLLIVLLVLMQRPKNEGLGAAFGGGMTDNLFGAQTTNVLQSATRWLGGLFFVCTLLLSFLYIRSTTATSSTLKKLSAPTVIPPAATPAPAADAKPLPTTPGAASEPVKPAPTPEAEKKSDAPAPTPEAAKKPEAPTNPAEPKPDAPAPAPAPAEPAK